MRRGLEQEVKAARGNGQKLPGSLLASLRHLADREDALNRRLARQGEQAKAYDHLPLVSVSKEYRETHALVFKEDLGDPFEDLLADLARAEAGNPPQP
jgi:hypothetical protein